jgi:hypothetical protein
VEHAQEHLGQAYLTRQLWEAQHSVRQSGRRLQARD